MDTSERRPVSVLLVDDEAGLRRAFERYFRRVGHNVMCAATLAEGRIALSETQVDVAFIDYKLPDGSGAELIRWAVANRRALRVYCMTGNASGRAASDLMQSGCMDVLEKPVDLDRLAALVPSSFADTDALTDTLLDFDDADAPIFDHDLDEWRTRFAPEILGEDRRLLEALETIRSVADTDCTVLVTGESGTGKELIARALHKSSPRAQGPFVALNCAAIPDTMIEAELFGHARGAFTGAHATRIGRIAAANGGTLFLDEIGDMPLHAQSKLLRVLQDRTITPVGADLPASVDVRIVAATNQDLDTMVDDGRFRADLYYRLSVIPIDLPPLRERRSDILVLAQAFMEDANRRNRRDVTGLDSSAEKKLLSHGWPGNIRELAHLVERTVLLKGRGVITASDLRIRRSSRNSGVHQMIRLSDDLDLRSAMDQVERQLIDKALQQTGGNRTEAATLLGVNRTTLVEKIRKHNSSSM